MSYSLPEARVYIRETASDFVDAQPVRNVEEAVEFVRDMISPMDRECLVVVTFDIKYRPLNYHIASIGDIDSSIASISNIIKIGILSNASAIMLFHNHPSGSITPSKQDDETTMKLKSACDIMNIKLLDHIIYGKDSYYSYHARDKV